MAPRERVRWAASAAAVAVAAALSLSGCSAGTSAFAGPAVSHVGAPVTYVDVFDPATEPANGGATYQSAVFGTLPSWATSYEAQPSSYALSQPSAGLSEVAQLAAAESPTVVTLSYGMTAALGGVPGGDFAAALASLLGRLRADHTATVLVANLIPANLSPGLSTSPTAGSEIDEYNQVIARQAADDGAVVVDLHSAIAAAVREHGPGAVFSPTGYLLTALGAGVVARTFSQAIHDRRVNPEGARAT